jgi:hypothetical protein
MNNAMTLNARQTELSRDKAQRLAYVEGLHDGKSYHSRSFPPLSLLTSNDDYARGFQAGYCKGYGVEPRLGIALAAMD